MAGHRGRRSEDVPEREVLVHEHARTVEDADVGVHRRANPPQVRLVEEVAVLQELEMPLEVEPVIRLGRRMQRDKLAGLRGGPGAEGTEPLRTHALPGRNRAADRRRDVRPVDRARLEMRIEVRRVDERDHLPGEGRLRGPRAVEGDRLGNRHAERGDALRDGRLDGEVVVALLAVLGADEHLASAERRGEGAVVALSAPDREIRDLAGKAPRERSGQLRLQGALVQKVVRRAVERRGPVALPVVDVCPIPAHIICSCLLRKGCERDGIKSFAKGQDVFP